MPGDDEGLIPSVEPQVAPSVDLPRAATPDALGAPIAEGVENLGMTAFRISENKEIRDDHIAQIAAQDGIQAVILDDQKGLHGKDGLLFQEAGIGAPKASDDYLKQRDEKVSQIRNALPTDAARKSFDIHEREQRANVKSKLAAWQDHQVNDADAKAMKVSNDLHLSEAIIGASESDPNKRNEAVNIGLAKGSMNIIDYAQRHNWPKEQTDLALKEYSSDVVTNVVKTLADSGDHRAAQAFFDDHKDDVTGQGMMQVQSTLKVSHAQNESREIADGIIASGGTLDERREMVKELTADKDAVIRDQVMSRVFQDDREVKTAHEEDQGAILDRAVAAIEQDPNHAIPPSDFASADPKRKSQMLSFQSKFRTHGEIITDDTAYNEMVARASSTDPVVRDKYLKENLVAEYADKLAPPVLREAINTQARLRNEKAQNIQSATTVNAQMESRVMREILPVLGITPAELKEDGKKYDQAEANRETLLRERFRQAVLAEQKGKEDAISFETAKKIASRLIAEEVVPAKPGFMDRWSIPSPLDLPRAIFGGKAEVPTEKIRSFENPDNASLVYSSSEIPADKLKVLKEERAKVGASVEEDDLIRAYNALRISHGR